MSPLGDPPRRSVRRRRALLLSVLSVAVAATAVPLTGVVGAATGPGTPTTPDGEAPPYAEGAPAATIEPALLEGFVLLRREQTQADQIPAAAQPAFSQASGANPALARRVSDGAGAEAWLIAGNGAACILARVPEDAIGGAVCVPTASARAGQLDVQSASSHLPGSELVAGVVPDGIESVTLRLADGSSVPAQLREGVYLALVRGAVVEIEESAPGRSIAMAGMSASSASPRFAP